MQCITRYCARKSLLALLAGIVVSGALHCSVNTVQKVKAASLRAHSLSSSTWWEVKVRSVDLCIRIFYITCHHQWLLRKIIFNFYTHYYLTFSRITNEAKLSCAKHLSEGPPPIGLTCKTVHPFFNKSLSSWILLRFEVPLLVPVFLVTIIDNCSFICTLIDDY